MDQQVRPSLASYDDLAKMMGHSLLSPVLSNEEVLDGLSMARKYNIAAATVRPNDIDMAVRQLQGASVRPGSAVGFPHGSGSTGAKLFETRDLLRRGAKEIDLVIAISKLLSREFQYVQTELNQVAEACRKDGALLKVTLETAYLTDELKIIACACCERADVNVVKTSTGFGPGGYTVADLKLLRDHLPEEIGVEAAHGIESLDAVFEAYDAGASRMGMTATAAILDEWKTRLAATV